MRVPSHTYDSTYYSFDETYESVQIGELARDDREAMRSAYSISYESADPDSCGQYYTKRRVKGLGIQEWAYSRYDKSKVTDFRLDGLDSRQLDAVKTLESAQVEGFSRSELGEIADYGALSLLQLENLKEFDDTQLEELALILRDR